METDTEPALSRYLHQKGCRLGLPISGTFELTARCNFDCKMCYVHLSAEEEKSRGMELSADEWLSIASDAADKGMVFLLLTGGEPLIRPDFRYLLTELKKMGIAVSINTNGSMVDGDLLDFFREEPPFRMNITLYGASEETYERVCGRSGFNKVVENIRALHDMGIGVKVNASMTPYNAADLRDIYEIGEKLGVPVQMAQYMFPPVRKDEALVGTGDRFTAKEAGLCSVEWDKLRFSREKLLLRAENLKKGIAAAENRGDCEGLPGEGIQCRAGRASFWINWLGMMTPCGMMTEPSFSVKELGFADAWERTKAAAAEIRLPQACSACEYRHACHVCAAMCAAETGSFCGKPEYVCEMTKTALDATLAEAEKLIGEEEK